jgi:cytochrome c peroxidase
VSVETDSVSTLYTRRGTGYYKVPSLRGVWFRGAFFHNGNLTRLEEVLDPKRLQADYVPTGFKPPHLKTMAVKGHPFGLDLGAADKAALVAFLKTL